MVAIGILGAAGIAPQAMIEPVRRRNDVVVHGVASRRPGVAAEYAKKHKIANAYDSYEAMLADPAVDLIYNCLPPSEHARWSIAALHAGKHVLCEKPFAMNQDEAGAMVAAAEEAGLHLLEGFHDRYHPIFLYLMDLKAKGRLGRVRSIKAEFSVTIPFDPKNIRHDPAAGGGALMDLGCYPVHWVRSLLNEEPDMVIAATGTKTELGVDERITATLRFPSGILADVTANMAKGTPYKAILSVDCEHGTVEIENPVLPHRGHSIRERLSGGFRQHTVAGGTTYDYQLDAVVKVLTGQALAITGGSDAICNMAAIDAIYAKAGFSR